MPLILLSENNTLSKKVVRAPLPENSMSVLEIPFRKLRKRALISFKSRLEAPDILVFAEPALNSLVPVKNADTRGFFNSRIADILYRAAKLRNIHENRLVIFDPSEEVALSALHLFRDIALAGDNALPVANYIFRQSGASLPIVSGSKSSDILLFLRDCSSHPACFSSGFDLKSGENTLGCDSLKVYPKAEYSSLTAFLGRPLSLTEAALLSEYDKKATFNIAF